jgi:2',3'-cyclic-nucleotide 2'-phosphodiesterase (5'-nucleotidase family)
MARLGYDAANVGERDLSLGYDEFVRRTEGATFPFVSANIVRRDTREPVFNPYVILEVEYPESDDPLRVGVLGVVRFNPVFLRSGPDDSNLVILPPLEAVKRYLEEVSERSDVVVLLAAIHQDDAHIIAKEVPGIDIVLGSYGSIYSTREEVEGDTLICYSGNQGRRVGESRVFVGPDREVERITSFMHVLTARYPNDPEMQEYVMEVGRRVAEHRRARGGGTADGASTPAATEGEARGAS